MAEPESDLPPNDETPDEAPRVVQGNSTEAEGIGFNNMIVNPTLYSVILPNLVHHMKARELLQARLVGRYWNEIAVRRIRKLYGARLSLMNLTTVNQFTNVMKNSKMNPYSKYIVRYPGNIMGLRGNVSFGDPVLKNFVKCFGEDVKHLNLELKGCHASDLYDFVAGMQNLINLDLLLYGCIDGPANTSVTPAPDCDGQSFKKLKRLKASLSNGQNLSKNVRQMLEQCLKLAPELEEIDVETKNDNVFVLLLKHLANAPCLPRVRSLATFRIGQAESFMKGLLDLKNLTLTRFCVHFDSTSIANQSQQFTKFLQAQALYLQTLELTIQHKKLTGLPSKQVVPLLPGLKTLKLLLLNTRDGDFVSVEFTGLPALRKLSCMEYGTRVLWLDRQIKIFDRRGVAASKYWPTHIQALASPQITSLELSCATSREQLELVAASFTGLQALKISARKDLVGDIKKKWQVLPSLDVYPIIPRPS